MRTSEAGTVVGGATAISVSLSAIASPRCVLRAATVLVLRVKVCVAPTLSRWSCRIQPIVVDCTNVDPRDLEEFLALLSAEDPLAATRVENEEGHPVELGGLLASGGR
jgi:hypothetical protein